MKLSHDERSGTLSLLLKDGAQVVESSQAGPGLILDYDVNDDLVSIEIFDAWPHVMAVRRLEFEVVADTPKRP